MDSGYDDDGLNKSIAGLTCRVCLNVDELMINIYDEIEDLHSNLVELLESCGGLIVDRLDDFPKYLCKVCAGELLVAAKFREKCSRSHEILNKVIISKAEPEEKTSDDNNSKLLILMNDSCNNNINQIETYSFTSLSDDILNEIIIEEVEPQEENNDKHEYCIEENLDFLQDTAPEQDLTDLNIVLDENNQQDQEIEYESVKDKSIDFDYIDIPPENLLISNYDKSKCIEETIRNRKQKMKTKRNTKFRIAAPLIFNCEECGAAFSKPENLNMHFRRNHQEVEGKLKGCSNCLQTFTKQESLENHLQTVHGDVASNPKNSWAIKFKCHKKTCNICGRICVSESSLKIHMRSHSAHRPFECSECHKTFKTKVAVNLHLKRHTGQFDWTCEFCGKGFVDSSNFKVHMRTHTGEKPHLCKLCGKKFSRVFLLQLHLRTHTGEKPYKCVACPKAYSQKCDLDIHFRSHTGMRPYICRICFKGFNRSYALHKHERQHTDTQV